LEGIVIGSFKAGIIPGYFWDGYRQSSEILAQLISEVRLETGTSQMKYIYVYENFALLKK
jgi:hypothetical protein